MVGRRMSQQSHDIRSDSILADSNGREPQLKKDRTFPEAYSTSLTAL